MARRPADPGAIAQRLGVPQEAIRRLRRRGFLQHLELDEWDWLVNGSVDRRPFAQRLRRVWRLLASGLDRRCVWILGTIRPSGGALLSLVVALVLVPSASGYDVPRGLNEVTLVYSLGAGEVRCPSRAEWDEDWASSLAWAYTNVRSDYTVLSPVVCGGALGVGNADVPAWQQALGALVLTHEAFHLRHWRFRRDEGKVECQSLANFRDATRRLGATAAQAEELYPYALALHGYKVRLFPQYRDPTCVIPPWDPPTTTG